MQVYTFGFDCLSPAAMTHFPDGAASFIRRLAWLSRPVLYPFFSCSYRIITTKRCASLGVLWCEDNADGFIFGLAGNAVLDGLCREAADDLCSLA